VSKNYELMQNVGKGFELPTFEDPLIEGSFTRKGSAERTGTFFNIKDKLIREETLKLAQNIFLLGNVESPRVVTFAGVDAGNGCSWLCAHIADILASQGLGSVCVVDANLRKPAMTNLFGTSNHLGLSDALSKGGPIRDFAKPMMGENLWLLPSGSLAADQVESASLLNSETMKVRISELRNEFDYVLIDSAPLSAHVEGVMLGQLADGLVLVLEANATRRETAVRIADSLRASNVRIVGAVLNKRTFPIPESVYHLL
jgi:capsular exopolysaccharide synthesis family protein